MALNATFHQLVLDKVLPIAQDTTNWTSTVTERYWNQAVAWVQGLLADNIPKATLDAFNDAASNTNTDLFDLIYSSACAALIWLHLKGIDEEQAVSRYNALKKQVLDLIEGIQNGQITVYDSSDAEVSVTFDGAGTFDFTQTGVEPTFRKARRDSDGDLLGSEEDGSLDVW